MLFHLLSEKTAIPLICCAVQLCLSLSFGITESFLLTIMAYDRYVAICLPLRYRLIITKRLCIVTLVASYVSGFFFSFVNTAFTLKQAFCGHNKINHFLCEMPALVRIACGGTHQAKMTMSISCVFTLILPLLLILVSYTCILFTILAIRSNRGRLKTISTCSSHLAVVTLFFGSVLSIYLRPKSETSMAHSKIASVFYIIVTPALNPIIYSLRNKEVLQALKKVMGSDRKCN